MPVYSTEDLIRLYNQLADSLAGKPNTPEYEDARKQVVQIAAQLKGRFKNQGELMKALEASRATARGPFFQQAAPPGQTQPAAGAGIPAPGQSTAQQPAAQGVPQSQAFNFYDKMKLDAFQDAIESGLPSLLSDMGSVEIKTTRYSEFIRVTIRPRTGGGASRPLVMDLAPGAMTAHGPIVNWYSRRGHHAPFGTEVFAESANLMYLHTPFQAFALYVKASFDTQLIQNHPNWSPIERFARVTTQGAELVKNAKIAGGIMRVSPKTSEYAQAELPTRVTVAMGPEIRDVKEVINAIQVTASRAQMELYKLSQAGQKGTKEQEAWAGLGGLGPIEEAGQARLRSLGPVVEEGRLQLAGQNVSKAISRLNIVPGGSSREQAEIITIDPTTRHPVVQKPNVVEEGKGSLRYLGATYPGTTERAKGFVVENIAVTPSEVMSGGAMMYGDPFLGAIAAGYKKYPDISLPQITAHQLVEATWEWGEFRERRLKGQPVTYERVSHELPSAIPSQSSRIIGLMKYKDLEGQPKDYPIRIRTQNAPAFLTSQSKEFELYIPPYAERGTGRWASTEGREVGSTDIFVEDIQKAFVGKVERSGMTQIELDLPYHMETGFKAAGGGWKVTFAPTLHPIGEAVKMVVQGREISGITGQPKNLTYAFFGHFAKAQPAVREEMLGEFASENPDLAKALVDYARGQHAKTEVIDGKETAGLLDSEEMAKIYAEKTGKPYYWRATAERMYEHLRTTVSKLPIERQAEKGYPVDIGPTWWKLGSVAASEKRALLWDLFGAARTYAMDRFKVDIATKKGRDVFYAKTGMTWKDIRDEIYSFEIEPKGKLATPERMYRAKRRSSAVVMDLVSAIVPEFATGNPAAAPEDVRAIFEADPEAARAIGFDPNDPRGARASGPVPRSVAAWREIESISSNLASRSRILPLPKHYTEFNAEQADVLAGKIAGGATAEELEGWISETVGKKGALYFPGRAIPLLPRFKTMENLSIEEFPEQGQEKEAVSRIVKDFPNLVRAIASGEEPDNPTEGGAAIREYLSWMEGVWSSSSRTVSKMLMRRWGGEGGRFTGLLGIGFTSAKLSDQALTNILHQKARASHIYPSKKWMKATQEQITEFGYLPMALVGAPALAGIPAQLTQGLTEAILRKRGLYHPTSTLVSASGKIRAGSMLTTGFPLSVGLSIAGQHRDWDGDQIYGAILATAEKAGLSFLTERIRPPIGDTQAERDRLWKQYQQVLMLTTGGSLLTPGGKFNVGQKEIMENVRALFEGYGSVQKTPFIVVDPQKANREAQAVVETVHGMGVSYRMRQMLESFASARGWPEETIAKGNLGMVGFYQTYLDKMADDVIKRGGFRNTETLLTTAIFGQSSFGEYSLLAMPEAQGKFQALWKAGYHEGETDPRIHSFTTQVGEVIAKAIETDIMEMETPNYELAAYMIAEKPDDIQPLATRMKQEGIYKAVNPLGSGAPGSRGYLHDHDITKSLFGASLIFSAYARTIGFPAVSTRKGPRTRDVVMPSGEIEKVPVMQQVADQPIPWMGKIIPLESLSVQPDAARAAQLFATFTYRPGYVSPQYERIRAPITPEEIEPLLRVQRLARERKYPTSFYLDYMLGQKQAADMVAAMTEQVPQFGEGISTLEAQNFIPASVVVGSSVIPYLAKQKGGPGLGTAGMSLYRTEADLVAAKRTQFVAEQSRLRIPSHLLTPAAEQQFQSDITGRGITFEAAIVPEITQRMSVYRYDMEGRPVIGPIAGVPRLTPSGEYQPGSTVPMKDIVNVTGQPELQQPRLEMAGHFAPDFLAMLLGEKGEATGIVQGSIKWSLSEALAATKVESLLVKAQESQYYHPLMAAGGNVRRVRGLLEAQIRGSTWFQEAWSPEAQIRFAQQANQPIPIQKEILAKQEEIVSQNVSMWRRALGLAKRGDIPYDIRIWSGYDDPTKPKIYTPVGVPAEEAWRGLEVTGAKEPWVQTFVAQGFKEAQRLMSPAGISTEMQQMATSARIAGTPFTQLGPGFMGLAETSQVWREWKGKGVVIHPMAVPGAKPPQGTFRAHLTGEFHTHYNDPNAVPTGEDPFAEAQPGIPSIPGIEMQAQEEAQPIATPSGKGVRIRQKGTSKAKQTAAQAAQGATGVPQSGNLISVEELIGKTINVGMYHMGIQSAPEVAALQARVALASAEGMRTPRALGFAERVFGRMQTAMGMTPEEAGRISFEEMTVRMRTGTAEQQEALRRISIEELPTTRELSNVYSGLRAGYRAAQAGVGKREDVAGMAPLLGKSQADVRREIGELLTVKGSAETEKLAESLRAAFTLKETTADWRTTVGGGKRAVTAENIEELGKVALDTSRRLTDLSKQFEASTSDVERYRLSQQMTQVKARGVAAFGRARLATAQQTLEEMAAMPAGEVSEEAMQAQWESVQQAGAQVAGAESQLAASRSPWVRRAFGQGQPGRFMRGLIGGWGLMYLSTLASYPMSTYQYGFQESEQFGTAMAQYGGGMMGGRQPLYPSLAYAQQAAGLRAGGSMFGWAQQAGTNVPPSARDIAGAGLGAIAGYAGALYVSDVALRAGLTGLGTAAGALALPISAGAFMFQLAGQQAAYQANPEQSYTTAVGDYLRGGTVARADAAWRMAGFIGGTGRASQMAGGVRNWLAGAPLGQMPQANMGLPAGQAEFVNQLLPGILAGNMGQLDERFRGIAPELIGQAAIRMQAGGATGQEMLYQLSAAAQRGIPTQQLAATMMAATRTAPSAGAAIQWEGTMARMAQNIWQAQEIASGAQLMEQLPRSYLERAFPVQAGARPDLTGRISLPHTRQGERLMTRAEVQQIMETQLAQRLEDYTRSPNLPFLTMEGQLTGAAQAVGVTRRAYPVPSVDAMPPAQARAWTQRQAMESYVLQQLGPQLTTYGIDTQGLYNQIIQPGGGFDYRAAGLAGQATNLIEPAMAMGLPPEQVFNYARQGFGQQYRLRMGIGMAQRAAIGGADLDTQGRLAGLALTQPRQAEWVNRVLNFEPFALTQAAQQGLISNQYAVRDIGLQGQLTGYPLFSTSLQQGSQMPVQTANQLFTPGWENRPTAQAMTFGINIQTGQIYTSAQQRQQAILGTRTPAGSYTGGVDPRNIVAGMQGGQWQQQWAGYDYQAATSGINMAQIALQEKYQPLFWNIQDRMTALQDRQQAWSFQMQGQQLGMQRSQFYENFALNQQGSQMQRQFTMQDWGWQNQMRQMQWGWRQEDFAENVRFMTGRERKLAERQMERETTMFGMEGTRIDAQRAQQKELWALEDQRFELSRKHFEESFKLQEENLKKQKEFYEEQKKLRDERTKLERAYWKEQIELQKQSAGASAAYAEKMKEAALDMGLVGKAQDDIVAQFNVATTAEVEMINTLIKGLNHIIKEAPDALASIVDALGGGGTKGIPDFGGGKKDKPKVPKGAEQIGGPHMPGISLVGEGGRELLESTVPMHVYPNNVLKSMLYGGESNYTSYWNNSYVDLGPPQRGGRDSPAMIVVNIGNKQLGKFVVDEFDKALEVS